MKWCIASLLAFCAVSGSPLLAQSKPLKIQKGDHISLIGNTLADRMQHDGWLETLFQSRFPNHELVIRNLGYSGDEVTLRLRSANFGSPEHWLTSEKTDVVFAFFGYNESFAGPLGLDKFKKDLDHFVKQTLSAKYNGKTSPRLVLFSPIAHENLHDRNLPDGLANNKRIAEYARAMAEVAGANGISFVDLYKPSLELYGSSTQPLTINGVHLDDRGNQLIAQAIDKALFAGEPEPSRDPQALEKIRQAVLDKNDCWFNRYRTVDGYSIYGGRADLVFTDGQTNRVVMQREMEVLDAMTANRDRRIWAVAQGRDLRVDDGNTPPFIPVKTNKPGPLPGGKHLFLDGEEAVRKMTVAKGMKVNLFASEKEFPELAKPVQMAFDVRGRLWVAVWPSYPHWQPKEERNDKLLILEDTDGDGKADKCTVFADHLHCPTGFEFYNGGVIVAQAPDVIFLKDSTGEGKADVRVRILDGIDSADTHHTANSFTLDPGGALYFQEGTFHHTQVETPYGPTVRNANAGVYRYEPRTQRFETYIAYDFANPHGHVFDSWGQDIVYDGTGANPYHAALFSGHTDYPRKHAHPPQVYQQWTRPCPGVEILSSRHFPEANQGNLLVANVIGFQGILQYKIEDDGSSFHGTRLEPLLSSTDPNFRPSDLKIGADGALYFLDWQNPIIGHMQHNLRDPSRDREHGRIYRVTAEGRPLLTPARIAGEPIEKLLDLLKEPEDRVRYRARIELGSRDSEQVVAAVRKWIDGLDKNDPKYEHHLTEALWMHQYHNEVNEPLLDRVLHSPDFHARAAATRVLCVWRDRLPQALAILKKLAADPHPRVRLEAVRAASFFADPEAVEIALITAAQPSDQYIAFTRGETMKTLEPYVKKALAEGRSIAFTSEEGTRYFLRQLGSDQLLKMTRTRDVCRELLIRKSIRDEDRAEALSALARLEGKDGVRVLAEMMREQDSGKDAPDVVDENRVFDWARLLAGRSAAELASGRPMLVKLALEGKQPITRELGFVALVAADGKPDLAWELTRKSALALNDLVRAIPLMRDPEARAGLYPKVVPLLAGLPPEFRNGSEGRGAPGGRYVRIELPGRRGTLTLAEVEVYSNGKNVAPQGKASQKNTAHGGVASRAIDGNKDGSFGSGGQTHTAENTSEPWWQLDLGREVPIDAIVIYNRTDGYLGKRLEGFSLKVFDADRRPVFEWTKQPAPAVQARYDLGQASPEALLRRAAMSALVSVRGQEAGTFKALAPFVRSGKDRQDAVQALQRIPAKYWPAEEAKPLLDSLLGYIRTLPTQDRTSAEALDALQFADSLAALLPPDQARKARRELGEVGVRILRIATVPDQMLFDKDRLAVQAGKPIQIVFENNDLMPHNFVLLQPGALEEIGNLAEATATQAGAAERHYVPSSGKILMASRLLQPRNVQKIDFVAPQQPGVYPYVCTYPGHWRRMYGALYVVDNLDQYLEDAEGYLAKSPVPAQDDLLKFLRPRKEWTFQELAASVEQMENGRSFSNGKQLFQAANCVACHRLNSVGYEIGPDLTKVEPKLLQPIEVLRDVLEPSFRINEKYTSYFFETTSGKVVTGLILEETPETVKVIENPLLKSDALVLKKSDIAERKKSPTSLMPKGLLDKLNREEILDLIAYISAKGDPQHRLFQGEHAKHHSGH